MAKQFEVTLRTFGEPHNVLVTEVGDYFEIDGIDVERIRVPKDHHGLVELEELMPELINHACPRSHS